jgi:replicative DNA helicase
MFDKYMEGWESGLFLFAGESNAGKTALTSALAWDYMANADNHLYLVFITLDDTADDVYPRIIAMNQNIPISVASKPVMYEQRRDEGDPEVVIIDDWLNKSQEEMAQLEELGEKFTLLDGTDITYGEEILEKCKDIKALIRTQDRRANILVVIDSGMDIEWRDKHFKSDKELNDYTARMLKKWAVEILDCPLFVTLHLRKIDQNRRPNVADIKESGRWIYEASYLGLVHNDVSRNKQAATICLRDEDDEITPVIELNWAKNKKSAYKGMTYQTFVTNHSLVKECPETIADRFDHLIYSN